ncbi:plasmid replication protein RepC [Paenirhodobacter hankyongi]|uniref:plasmid replication protein RepC n=1 Tax=Paenirhodobacter hankyongi TaxID=2294033 RepID=UPI00160067C8|nr:plasmid replication protein RepC [Sinirhodobacter hankyongi]
MQHISTTPFGRRPVAAGHLAQRALAEAPLPATAPDKWAILRDLTAARAAFGISDRDLAVLSALVSFHPHLQLAEGDGTIVFPSNAALGERTHGMAESTLRRHLAALVRAGLVLRHDSPNGKRYAARGMDGGLAVAFGFDLRPLLVRATEIAAAAEAARAANLRLKRLRESVVLRLRDASKLIAFGEELGGNWDALADRARLMARCLRRKLDAGALEALGLEAADLLEAVNARLSPVESEEMSGNALESERHIQDSNRLLSESEPSSEQEGLAEAEAPEPDRAVPKLPLYLVLKSCPDLLDYAPHGVDSWHELVGVADFVRPMLGISADAWREARATMGDGAAAVTLACMLQRASEIRSPGGYLRSLSAKAAAGGFSPGPMVMALLRADNTRAA